MREEFYVYWGYPLTLLFRPPLTPIQPEPWVHIDDPCEFRYDSNGKKSLASFVLPLLSSKTKITSSQLDAIVALCHSLYQSNSTTSSVSDINLENATFYEHIMNLNRLDGLRLATAQMVISSSTANNHLAGGDILRMGQNILQFENLRALLSSPSAPLSTIPMIERSSFHLLTLSMEDYMASAKNKKYHNTISEFCSWRRWSQQHSSIGS